MANFVSPNEIRSRFSALMSAMYQKEVPLYGDLIDLVSDVNKTVLSQQPAIKAQLESTGELPRLDLERHGAIRLGTAQELFNMRRIFAVMGMFPVGYYDLAPAGVPVHSTAFRAIDADSLNQSPFRVFTSLLRLELIDDEALRETAANILSKRQIFTDKALTLTSLSEQQGGLTEEQAEEFVNEVLETFRWHTEAPVSKSVYEALHNQHRLIADVVAFKGPHINHLTPRTLDIDAVQEGMAARNIPPKEIIEGPPRRQCPILLRQTSFKALEEQVSFVDSNTKELGSHTARFGEIEQRGVALTPKGRTLYDQLLNRTRQLTKEQGVSQDPVGYMAIHQESFKDFPDSYAELQAQGLAYFYYFPKAGASVDKPVSEQDIPKLLQQGLIEIEPIVYEDFLPVSAAGIFQSNLGGATQKTYDEVSNKKAFEQALGASVYDELALYAQIQQSSIEACLAALNH
ncbi:MAG: VOC family protein [Pelistega sp.]|nr:VOC family protein [Pelistega sp.]